MSSARGFVTLSVRLDPDTFQALKNFADDHAQYSQAYVVGRLIEYFQRQDPEVQHVILTGIEIDYLELIGRFFQLLDLGDHAYGKSFWLWSIENYLEADKEAAGGEYAIRRADEKEVGGKLRGVLSLRQLVWFKISSAFMDLGMEFRHRALVDEGKDVEDWRAHYQAAMDSLRVAIAYHRIFNASRKNQNDEPHPVILYNEACSWTLIAQYSGEMRLGPEDGMIKKLRKSAQQAEQRREEKKKRDDVCVALSDEPQATAALGHAMTCLAKIKSSYHSSSGRMPLGETHWMIEFADKDADLECLRQTRKIDFYAWFAEHKLRTQLLESFRTARNKLPAAVRDMLNLVEAD